MPVKCTIKSLFLVITVVLGGCGHPSDVQLLDRFRQHREELQQLVRMFQIDKGLGRVGSDFTRPEDSELVGVISATHSRVSSTLRSGGSA